MSREPHPWTHSQLRSVVPSKSRSSPPYRFHLRAHIRTQFKCAVLAPAARKVRDGNHGSIYHLVANVVNRVPAVDDENRRPNPFKQKVERRRATIRKTQLAQCLGWQRENVRFQTSDRRETGCDPLERASTGAHGITSDPTRLQWPGRAIGQVRFEPLLRISANVISDFG